LIYQRLTAAVLEADPVADAAGGAQPADVRAVGQSVEPSPARRVRRTVLGPLLLFSLFGVYYTIPPQGGDQVPHLSCIVEADRAMREGQFPLRVAPTVGYQARVPIFQFYGNFPYTLAALLMRIPLADVDAYEAWKLLVFLSVTCGGFYAYRCGLVLTRQVWPSLIAGAVFVASPYLSTDFRARFAFTEAVSLCLLPVVVYYSLRAFVTRRRGPVVAGGVAWALVALTHNITYLYGSALIALMFLLLASRDWRKYVRRMTRVGLAYALGLVLVLWFIVPQVKLLKYIQIAIQNTEESPLWTKKWAPLYALLSPVLTTSPAAAQTPAMGLQVGAPVMAVVVLSAVLVVRSLFSRFRGAHRASGLGRPGAALAAALLAVWALSFFILWSPVDFWRYVPRIFYNLQILYRMLMFVVLWGSLLAAVALSAWWRRRPGGMPAAAGWACLLGVAVAGMPFQGWTLPEMPRHVLTKLQTYPEIFAESFYRPLPEKIAEFRLAVPPGAKMMGAAETAARGQSGPRSRLRFDAPALQVVQFPFVFYPEGVMDVRDSGHKVRPRNSGHVDGYLAVVAQSGHHSFSVRFVGVRWANWVSGVAWLAVTAASLGALTMTADRALYAHYSRRLARQHSWAMPGPAESTAAPVLPVRAALVGAAVLIVPLVAMKGYVEWQRNAVARAVGKLSVSDAANFDVQAINAFDGDPTTVWAAFTAQPAWLVNEFPRPRRVSVVELEPREADRLGGWYEVDVLLHSGGNVVSRQHFSIRDADRQRLQVLKLDHPAVADKVELKFADPVLETFSGTAVDIKVSYPGYREIRFR
jgi:hypothetical protein